MAASLRLNPHPLPADIRCVDTVLKCGAMEWNEQRRGECQSERASWLMQGLSQGWEESTNN